MDTRLSQLSLVNDHTGATSNPIYLATAYQHPGLGESTGFDYTRTKNPTRTQFEEAFVDLEGGNYAFGTSSGMAAVQLVCNLFRPGDEILVSFDLYGGTFRLFDFYTDQYDIAFKYGYQVKARGSFAFIRKIPPQDLESKELNKWSSENPWQHFGYYFALDNVTTSFACINSYDCKK